MTPRQTRRVVNISPPRLSTIDYTGAPSAHPDSATMFSRNEILDSEDEGDFSPVKDRTGDVSYSAVLDALDAVDTPDQPHTNASSIKSTDPALFQRIYDDIRAVAHAKHSVSSPPTGELSPEKPPSRTKVTSSLTSVTSPREKSKLGRNKDIIDLTLTQVTTPSREAVSEGNDPWAPPSSTPPHAMASLSKVARSYGKRKRANQLTGSASDSMPPTQDPYDFPSTADLAPAKTKKVKKASFSSLADRSRDSSPILLVPPVEEPPSSAKKSTRGRNSSGYEPTIPATGTALYVAPSALTASQKQQYQLVHLSSEPEPTLPEVPQRSTCASTIPYSTPSQFASSRKRVEPVDELQNIQEYERVPTPDTLQSSPDVISEDTRPKKRKSLRESEEDLAGSAKRRRGGAPNSYADVEISADQDGEPAQLQDQEDTHQPQDTNMADTANKEITELQVVDSPPAPEPKKKRGRKRKEPKSSGAIMEETQHGLEPPLKIPEDPQEAITPAPAPAKKKRGRPRKSAIIPEPETPAVEQPDQEDHAPPVSTAKPGKRGRKKKETSTPKSPEYIPYDEEGKEVDKPAAALAEISRNSRSDTPEINASDEDEDNNNSVNDGAMKENSPVKKTVSTVKRGEPAPLTPAKVEEVVKKEGAKKEVKPVSSPAAGTKPLYRVGLSKKSRIAPLLKIIRK